MSTLWGLRIESFFDLGTGRGVFFLVVVRDSVRDGKTKCSTIESRLGMRRRWNEKGES